MHRLFDVVVPNIAEYDAIFSETCPFDEDCMRPPLLTVFKMF